MSDMSIKQLVTTAVESYSIDKTKKEELLQKIMNKTILKKRKRNH